jgi:hypothetical protein
VTPPTGTSDEQAVTDAGYKAAARARPKPKARANFTDPDSRIMKNGNGAYIQAYNAQAVVDEQYQVRTRRPGRLTNLASRPRDGPPPSRTPDERTERRARPHKCPQADRDRSHRSRPTRRLHVTDSHS